MTEIIYALLITAMLSPGANLLIAQIALCSAVALFTALICRDLVR